MLSIIIQLHTLFLQLAIMALLISIPVSSCGVRSSNEYSEAVYMCGEGAAPGQRFVQVKQESGIAFSHDELYGLHLQNRKALKNINFTEFGCFLPPQDGHVLIQTKDMTREVYVESSELDELQELFLAPKVDLVRNAGFSYIEQRNYFGKPFHFVPPGYTVDFSDYFPDSKDNFQYCMQPIEPDYDGQEIPKCNEFQLDLNKHPIVLNEGFWKLTLRTGKPESKELFFAIERECAYSNQIDRIYEEKCTVVSNIAADGDEVSKLKYLSKVLGRIEIYNSNTTDLKEIDNLIYAGDLLLYYNKNLKDLKSLSGLHVGGNLLVRYSSQLNLDTLSDIRIDGDLSLIELGDLSGSTFFSNRRLNGIEISFTSIPDDWLKNLSVVPNNLILSANFNVNSYEGLSSLESVGKNFLLGGHQNLLHLGKFNKLQKVGRDFTLTHLGPNIEDLDSFENLTTVDGRFRISNNEGLKKILGFRNLEQVGSSFYINDCSTLEEIDSFSLLNKSFQIGISRNRRLKKIAGFERIQSLDGDLSIRSNFAIEKIQGFANLTEIKDDLYLTHLPNISEFSALKSLSRVGGEVVVSSKVCNLIQNDPEYKEDNPIRSFCSKLAP